jgi:hypothetical protein
VCGFNGDNDDHDSDSDTGGNNTAASNDNKNDTNGVAYGIRPFDAGSCDGV